MPGSKIEKTQRDNRAAIIADIPKDESRQKLKEGSLLGRLCKRLAGLAAWHDLLYTEEGLYSTVCSKCDCVAQRSVNTVGAERYKELQKTFLSP